MNEFLCIISKECGCNRILETLPSQSSWVYLLKIWVINPYFVPILEHWLEEALTWSIDHPSRKRWSEFLEIHMDIRSFDLQRTKLAELCHRDMIVTLSKGCGATMVPKMHQNLVTASFKPTLTSPIQKWRPGHPWCIKFASSLLQSLSFSHKKERDSPS